MDIKWTEIPLIKGKGNVHVLTQTFQNILCSFPASFSAHTCEDKVVLLVFLLSRLYLCALYLSLKVLPVDRMYFIVETLVFTSAWSFLTCSFFKGQSACILQLHNFFSITGLHLFITVELCLLICFVILLVVE